MASETSVFSGAWTTKITRGSTTLTDTSSSGSESIIVSLSGRPVLQASSKGLNGWREPTNFEALEYTSVPPQGSQTNTSTYLPTTPDTVYKYTFNGCLCAASGGAYQSTWEVPWEALGKRDPSSNVVQDSINRALNDVKDQNVNYGVLLGELTESVGLIVTTGVKILTALKKARKGDFKGAAKILGLNEPLSKTVSGKHLELQFGWLPMLNDVAAVYNDIVTKSKGIKLTGRGSSSTTMDEIVSLTRVGGTLWGVEIHRKITEEAFTRLDYSLSDANINKLASRGLLNPLEVAWELIPFSFVVDYFVSIGSAIETLASSAGLGFKAGSTSVRVTVEETHLYSAWVLANNANWTYSGTGSAQGSKRRKDIRRSVHLTEPSGGVYLKPTVPNAMKVANLLALINQLR